MCVCRRRRTEGFGGFHAELLQKREVFALLEGLCKAVSLLEVGLNIDDRDFSRGLVLTKSVSKLVSIRSPSGHEVISNSTRRVQSLQHPRSFSFSCPSWTSNSNLNLSW